MCAECGDATMLNYDSISYLHNIQLSVHPTSVKTDFIDESTLFLVTRHTTVLLSSGKWFPVVHLVSSWTSTISVQQWMLVLVTIGYYLEPR